MKVLDLQCLHQHLFEGWYVSEDDFAGQLERAQIECPMCGDTSITRMLSAPRLNLGSARNDAPARPDVQDLVSGDTQQVQQAAWLNAARRIVAATEDVGERFAEEARKIHYGEAEERGIRGKASRAETEALIDEGVAVMPLPMSGALKETLQ